MAQVSTPLYYVHVLYVCYNERLCEYYLTTSFGWHLCHNIGVVGRVYNNTYQCLKGKCRGDRNDRPKLILDDESFQSIHSHHIEKELISDNKFSRNNAQPQYQYIPPAIIVEKDILTGNHDINKDVTYWYVSDGIILFVSQQCEANSKDIGRLGTLSRSRKFYSSRYEALSMKLGKDICSFSVPKPKTWERQRRIVESMRKHLPKGVVRIDLYAGENEIYFSEFTFTTAGCDAHFTPAVADGLLYAVSHERISHEDSKQPEYVEGIINGIGSWALVGLNKQKEIRAMRHYPSPLDLCEGYAFQDDFLDKPGIIFQQFNDCIDKARNVFSYPKRCIIDDGSKQLSSFGMHTEPTVQRVMEKFVWSRIFSLAIVLVLMFVFNIGVRKVARSQIILINILFAVVAVASDVFLHQGQWFSHLSTIGIIKESYNAFYHVHPVEHTAVAMSHFLTYWVSYLSL